MPRRRVLLPEVALGLLLGLALLLLASATAEAALTMPAPQDFWSHVDKGVAVFCRMVTISVVFRSGFRRASHSCVGRARGERAGRS